MELSENTASPRTVGRKGKSQNKNKSMAEPSRYRYLGCAAVTACSIALTTGSASLDPLLHINPKYSLASSMYCRLNICFCSSLSFSQISKPVFIFRMLVAWLKLPGWMMLTWKQKYWWTYYVKEFNMTTSQVIIFLCQYGSNILLLFVKNLSSFFKNKQATTC